MAKIDLSKYGITGTTEVVYNPSYELLFEEETKPELEGYEKGQVTNCKGAVWKVSSLREKSAGKRTSSNAFCVSMVGRISCGLFSSST